MKYLFELSFCNNRNLYFAGNDKRKWIRLTNERWHHISIGHPEMADFYYEIFETIENPIIVYSGNSGELIALSREHQPSGKFFVVVYKEMNSNDGFVITAYLSNKQTFFEKKEIIWKQSQ